MGNWTTVNIKGTCPADELHELREFTRFNTNTYEDFHCLVSSDGLCGLGDWAQEVMNAQGNLAERGYNYESVAKELTRIAPKVPNADIKIHIGSDYESLECIKTVHLHDGEVEIKEPEISTLDEISEDKIEKNLYKAMLGW